MSRSILRALMQLFALAAKPGSKLEKGREFLVNFLRRELGTQQVATYLAEFQRLVDQNFSSETIREELKHKSSSSVKMLRICTKINEELTYSQKCFVFIRLSEFIAAGEAPGGNEFEFLDTVAQTLLINATEQGLMRHICIQPLSIYPHEHWLRISGKVLPDVARQYVVPGLDGQFILLFLPEAGSYFLKYLGQEAFYLAGQLLNPDMVYPFPPGSVIRGTKISPLFYSDLVSKIHKEQIQPPIIFQVSNLEYKFPNGKQGLHRISFSETSGSLVGIMGSSGTGKSTLLNVLNGNVLPSAGRVSINGVDIHAVGNQTKGLVGYVSQDDTLFEDLTVFQNLWYNALLCFDKLSKAEIRNKVDRTLKEFGLDEIRDLKVGSQLTKVISGGQRKRLNIALELIREPAVLFLDEPTSGLSSRDSENIMDLLKELAIHGKLVFVVIHQPSSNIFKMFDRLILVDVGGYPIYYGNPLEAVIYFRSLVDHVKPGESECPECGNVNPEQLFDILEARVINEHGRATLQRKVLPKEWNMFYKRISNPIESGKAAPASLPQSFQKPSRLKQFFVFCSRDIRSKVSNHQYMLLNLLEAPLLAFLMAYFLKYRHEGEYQFYNNLNIPAYLFVCVLTSLFFGLTVSAEELFRERLIRRRERFLELSYGTYLSSKTLVLFVLSAIQSISFILVGHYVLEVRGLFWGDWLVLFSVSAFANMLGLNISSAFNSVITIYVLVPLLIIPQILLSGVIVKFENLNPEIVKNNGKVPLVANLMATRWAYEAIVVNRFTKNICQNHVLSHDIALSECVWRANYWFPKMEEMIDEAEKNAHSLRILQIEIRKTNALGLYDNFNENAIKLNVRTTYSAIHLWLEKIRKQANQRFLVVQREKDKMMAAVSDSMVKLYTNDQLSALVKRSDNFEKIQKKSDGTLLRTFEPVYQLPEPGYIAAGQFYAPFKRFGSYLMSTLFANVLVIWLMTFLLAAALRFNMLSRILGIAPKHLKLSIVRWKPSSSQKAT